MKKAGTVLTFSLFALSLTGFVLALFPFVAWTHYAFLVMGAIFVFEASFALHELIHVLFVQTLGSTLVAVHILPFYYEEGGWKFGTSRMCVDFIEPSRVKSAWIYMGGFLFSLLLEGALVVWFVLSWDDMALVSVLVVASYFLTVAFPGGDLFQFVRSLRRNA